MGYACPVCGAEQSDAVHLAHHLAVTASLGRPDHREWLEEHAPSWGDSGPEELAEAVAPHAPEVDAPAFDDAGHDRRGGRPSFEDELAHQTRAPGRGGPAAGTGAGGEAEGVLEEARELTRRMHEGDADAGESRGHDQRGDGGGGDDDGGRVDGTAGDGDGGAGDENTGEAPDDGDAADGEENA